MTPEQERRFWAFVRIEHDDLCPSGGCWLWQGKKVSAGYGRMTIGNKRGWETTHRLSYAHFNGVIPKDAWVLHTCDTPACVNPAHLFLGDSRANTRDRHEKGRDYRWPRHHFAHITPKDVTFIRASRGIITRERLAEKYGISKQAITSIWKRRNWGWVPEAPR